MLRHDVRVIRVSPAPETSGPPVRLAYLTQFSAYPRRDSNPYARKRYVLNVVRLPFHHLGKKGLEELNFPYVSSERLTG